MSSAPDARPVHLVPGPDGHGVVRHGERLAEHLPHQELLRCHRLDDLAGEVGAAGPLRGRVVLAQVTDRLIAGDPVTALSVWRSVTSGAARLTVWLHDLPQASDGRWRRARVELYAAIAASADDVVVASRHEVLLLAAALRVARPDVAAPVLARTQVLPLPIEPARCAEGFAPHPTGPATVATLGYVYPGKGLEEVIDATAAAGDPAGARLVNLGAPSSGHDDLLPTLERRAADRGLTWSCTGHIPDADLPEALAGVTVPVAAHRHVSASGSIATWLEAGRRPIVLATRYTRELADRLPGALEVVPESGLADAIAGALRDPARTWLPDGVHLGPTWAQVAADVDALVQAPALSVVIPYYRDQELLTLLLHRLGVQDRLLGPVEVVVADDGSPQPPQVDAYPGTIRVVRQPDHGFRAAAARNLGARHTRGRAVVFLDGDSIPDDGALAALQRAVLDAPTLAVGRRRHADLRGERGWPPTPLVEPDWLREGYAATRDLRDADDASFRFVISAVLAVSRQVWDAVGGFDATLAGYGGEDWDLGWRAWLAGAELRHLPEAVVWHDGPDLEGRADAGSRQVAEVKNAETLRLATRLPHPLVRGRGWRHEQPDVVAVLEAVSWSPGQVVVAAEALLRLGDVGVWVLGGVGSTGATSAELRDGEPPAAILERARAVVRISRPVAVRALPWPAWPGELTARLAPTATDLTTDPASGVCVVAVRHRGRARLLGEPLVHGWLTEDQVEAVPTDVVIERWRQGHP